MKASAQEGCPHAFRTGQIVNIQWPISSTKLSFEDRSTSGRRVVFHLGTPCTRFLIQSMGRFQGEIHDVAKRPINSGRSQSSRSPSRNWIVSPSASWPHRSNLETFRSRELKCAESASTHRQFEYTSACTAAIYDRIPGTQLSSQCSENQWGWTAIEFRPEE